MSLRRNGLSAVMSAAVMIFASTLLISTAEAERLTVGTIFSSDQPTSKSFLRFYNSSSSAGTAFVSLQDSSNGVELGTWTTPSIEPNSEVQFLIDTLENEASQAFTKPTFYTVLINPSFGGSFQHVLWKPADGTLTNLSTCAGNVTSTLDTVIAFHTSTLSNGYPSSLVVTNTGVEEASADLAIYNAKDGSLLGSFSTEIIPIGAQIILTADRIEELISFTPTSSDFHYNIVIENAFNGYVQHLVNNETAGVVTDMTALCALTADEATPVSTFEGVLAGGSDESGTINIEIETDVNTFTSSSEGTVIESASSASQRQFEKPSATVNASGTYAPNSGAPVSLTGTYDDSTRAVNLSGGSFTFNGSVDTEAGSQRLSGTYSSTSSSGGFSTTRNTPTNRANTRYCGNWSGTVDGGFVEGTWNFTIRNSGSVSGRTANKTDGDNQNMSGVYKGDRVSGTTSDGTTWQGTISGRDFTGTFNSEGDTGQLTGRQCSFGL